MAADDPVSPVPRWGTPKQWYLLGLLGFVAWIGLAALAGFAPPEPVADFVLRPLGMLGCGLFFAGFGIGVTKSRQPDREARRDK